MTHVFDTIFQERITNSDELLTIVPVSTIYSNMNSRIILLKIDGEINAVVFSINQHENSTQDSFNGEILITDLQGNFMNGYRVHNSRIVARYVMEKSTKTNQKSSDCGSCIFSQCDLCQRDEVVLHGSKTNSVPLGYVFIIRTSEEPEESSLSWEYSSGGGSGSGSTSLTFDPAKVYYDEGDRPLEEYDDKCEGISRMWTLSQNGNEYSAVLTKDGGDINYSRIRCQWRGDKWYL